MIFMVHSFFFLSEFYCSWNPKFSSQSPSKKRNKKNTQPSKLFNQARLHQKPFFPHFAFLHSYTFPLNLNLNILYFHSTKAFINKGKKKLNCKIKILEMWKVKGKMPYEEKSLKQTNNSKSLANIDGVIEEFS
jgi:hypothetical protein